MNKILGIIMVVIAITIILIPVFTDCASQGKSLTTDTGKTVPMKCHWTGIAEIGVAIPLLVIGVMITLNRLRNNLRNLGIIVIILGALAIAFPIFLIGVCQTPTMLCHSVLSPALVTLGAIVVFLGLGTIVLSLRANNQ